jgi:hypothetical protein
MNQIVKLAFLMRSTLIAAVAVAGLYASSVPQVYAQSAEPLSARQVFVGGTLFLTVRSSWGGRTPEQRADEVQQRINAALSIGPIRPSDITVGLLDGDWVVYLRHRRLYTADAITAKQDDIAPQLLAEQWAAKLRHQLATLTAPTNGH